MFVEGNNREGDSIPGLTQLDEEQTNIGNNQDNDDDGDQENDDPSNGTIQDIDDDQDYNIDDDQDYDIGDYQDYDIDDYQDYDIDDYQDYDIDDQGCDIDDDQHIDHGQEGNSEGVDDDQNFDDDQDIDDNQENDLEGTDIFDMSDEEIENEVPQDETNESERLHNDDDTPLYAGAPVTIKITMILILAFVTRHKLTNEAISDLLYLLNIICPGTSKCLHSVYKFKKYFSNLVTPINFCYYCPACLVSINYPIDKTCTICKRVFTSLGELSYYLHLSICDQLRTLFMNSAFANNILYRFKRRKQNEDNIEDIYDGTLYKKLAAPGKVLSVWQNLSLTWNVDGVPIFKSSKFSIWPLYLVINELPYKLRMLKENTLFGGLWFGEIKPNILKPLFSELSNLATNGIQINSPFYQNPFVCKVVLLAGTCDLPAKCLVLNTIQFNGNFAVINVFSQEYHIKQVVVVTYIFIPMIQIILLVLSVVKSNIIQMLLKLRLKRIQLME